MTTHYKTKVFVFKKNNTNETDRVFSVFTEDFGRLDVFGKAIRKLVSKLRSGIDTFFISDIEFIQGKSRKTLTEAKALNKFEGLSKDPQKFQAAQKMAGVLDSLIRGQEKDEKIFDLLSEVFIELDREDFKKYTLLYYYFMWNFLSLLGYKLQVEKCNICSAKLNPYYIYFSYKSGGAVCKNCSRRDGISQKISSDIIKILRLIYGKEWSIISKLKIGPISQKLFEKISDDYYSHIHEELSSKKN